MTGGSSIRGGVPRRRHIRRDMLAVDFHSVHKNNKPVVISRPQRQHRETAVLVRSQGERDPHKGSGRLIQHGRLHIARTPSPRRIIDVRPSDIIHRPVGARGRLRVKTKTQRALRPLADIWRVGHTRPVRRIQRSPAIGGRRNKPPAQTVLSPQCDVLRRRQGRMKRAWVLPIGREVQNTIGIMNPRANVRIRRQRDPHSARRRRHRGHDRRPHRRGGNQKLVIHPHQPVTHPAAQKGDFSLIIRPRRGIRRIRPLASTQYFILPVMAGGRALLGDR